MVIEHNGKIISKDVIADKEAIEATIFALDSKGKIISLGSIRSQGTLYPVSLLDGKLIRANVYNCGGIGNEAHYVSWNPIATKKPDFHRPEFFRPIYFCK